MVNKGDKLRAGGKGNSGQNRGAAGSHESRPPQEDANPLLPPDPTRTGKGELAKSGRTRRRILEAGIAVLDTEGYSGFSTSLVAEKAGITRPAMLYHFRSRFDLLAALTQYCVRRRLEMFEVAMAALPPMMDGTGDYYRARATEIAWDHLDLPEYRAFVELTLAARTDPELKAIVDPIMLAFDLARLNLTERTLPPEVFDLSAYSLARDVVRFLSEGVMMQDAILHRKQERIMALRHFLFMLTSTEAGKRFQDAIATDLRERMRAVDATDQDAMPEDGPAGEKAGARPGAGA